MDVGPQTPPTAATTHKWRAESQEQGPKFIAWASMPTVALTRPETRDPGQMLQKTKTSDLLDTKISRATLDYFSTVL